MALLHSQLLPVHLNRSYSHLKTLSSFPLWLKQTRFQHSTSSPEVQKRLEITQSWTAEHKSENGTLHRFATVIIDQGKQPGAAALAWHHARKLLGSQPNVGVAYVSIPTRTAGRAVAELAARMGAANVGGGAKRVDIKRGSSKEEGAQTSGREQNRSEFSRSSPASYSDKRTEERASRTGESLRMDGRWSRGPILFDDSSWQRHAKRERGFGRAERRQKAVIYKVSDSSREPSSSRNDEYEQEKKGSLSDQQTDGILPLAGCTASSWAYQGNEDTQQGGKETGNQGGGKRGSPMLVQKRGFAGMSSKPQSYIELPPLKPGGVKSSSWVRLIYPQTEEYQSAIFKHWSSLGFNSMVPLFDEGPDIEVILTEGEMEESSDSEEEEYTSDEESDHFEQLSIEGGRLMTTRDFSSFHEESDEDESEALDHMLYCVDQDQDESDGDEVPLPSSEDGVFIGLMDGEQVSLEELPVGEHFSRSRFLALLKKYLEWKRQRASLPAELAGEEREAWDHLQSEVQELLNFRLEAFHNKVTNERRLFLRFVYSDPEGLESEGIFYLNEDLIPPDDCEHFDCGGPDFEPLKSSDAFIRQTLQSSSSGFQKESSETLPPGYKYIQRPPEEGSSRDSGGEGGTQSRDGEALEDLPFRLTFVAGLMPGVKVEAFHTKTAALPNLRNLEEMILTSQPHFLLFGQPGFDHSAFRDRLSSLFPDSAKAGVFSTPVSVLSSEGGSVMDDGPLQSQLYFGEQTANKGACGLALYSANGGLVPVDAFAAFVKEAIGAPRFSGTFVFDSVVSRELFRPNKKEASRTERRKALQSADEKLESLESLFKSWSARLDGPVNSRINPSGTRRASTMGIKEESELWKGPKDPDAILDGLQLANRYIEQRKASLEARFGPLEGGENGPENHPLKRNPRLAPGKVAKLPLFLVDPPPCPGETIERFIFEPRYRLLAKHCIEEGSPLGVCGLDPDPVTGQIVGTAASIEVTEYDEAFRSNVELHGIRRFRLTTPRIWVPPSSFGLYVAEVQFFDDDPCKSDQERRELVELARRSVALFEKTYPDEWRREKVLSTNVDDPVAVSFALAEALPTRPYTKQRWLAGTCTRQRLQEQMHNMKKRSTETSSKSECIEMDG